MKLNIILILSLIGISNAQQRQCLILPPDTVCGSEFKGQPVLSPAGDFSSKIEFEENIQTFTNDTFMAAQYGNEFGCNRRDIKRLIPSIRYPTVFWCAFYVQFAIQSGCKSTNDAIPNGPKLCRGQCDLHILSVRDIISQCLNTTAAQSHLNILSSVCNATSDLIDQDDPAKYCTTGTELESKYCGWPSLSIAQRSCKQLKRPDNCCTSIVQLLEQEGLSQTQEVFNWWVITLILISSLAILIGLYFGVRFLVNRNGSMTCKKDEENSKVEVSSSRKDLPNSSKEDQNEKNIVAPANISTKVKEVKPAKTAKSKEGKTKKTKDGLFNRLNKKYPSLSDDLEKAKAKGDQSLNTLMKFFGGGKDLSKEKSLPTIAEAFPNEPPKSADALIFTANNAEKDEKAIETPIKTSDTGLEIRSEASKRNEVKSIETGKTVVVIDTYEAKSPDELSLTIGELIYIKSEFDDGWAVGIEQKSKKEGVFPLMCTAKIVTTTSA